MHIRLISVIGKVPEWVAQGYQEYAKRLPAELNLDCINIPLSKRYKNQKTTTNIEQEGKQILASIPKGDKIIALEVTGKTWTTPQLTQQLQNWLTESQSISLLIGGPDGLAKSCLMQAHQTWSLSPLTLPHAMVRIIIAEQLYRAWSILQNHPYHR